MFSGWLYKWIDVTDWEFGQINNETRRLNSQGWVLDEVLDDIGPNLATVETGTLQLRFKRRAAA